FLKLGLRDSPICAIKSSKTTLGRSRFAKIREAAIWLLMTPQTAIVGVLGILRSQGNHEFFHVVVETSMGNSYGQIQGYCLCGDLKEVENSFMWLSQWAWEEL
ncbi:unnamed protein product, partial [Ceratitis capitata]